MAISTLPANSSHCVHYLVWKGIWKIKTLPKIKFFRWRLLNKSISTKLSLYIKRISARCSFIFENKPLDPIRTITAVVTAAQDFKSATNNYPQHDSHISPHCNFIGNNLSPITNHSKISFDGAWLVVSCPAGLGVIRKTADGHFGGGLAEKKNVCSALCAEAEAALLGISMARDLGDC
ncbi:hypothetical protein Pyn_29685 [Prunus yedoensis var. nudiflora]|uniref:RNase H type-1 domain-containing protein n=1 Tax=Prunus yedoensis var. nudiflora TaxID=2094558 RepID=A0A314YTG1_PRUYE|nr:hypothetical protein Pyn_29685 [Prunus yedoensis var. nudiflora]